MPKGKQQLAARATDVGALAVQHSEISASVRSALKNSLYPGATDASIDMVVAYCQAGGLDPLTKPVHIVPMSVKKPGSRDQYEYRDVVMPGIELYRIKAHRSGKYAGMSSPEFGPDVTSTFKKKGGGTVEFTHPKWCDIVVYRQPPGEGDNLLEFPARVYWLETYATEARDSEVPNAMWRKRPYGQLEKCTEALALRRAFPEFVGAQPTAEEMAGKSLDPEDVVATIEEPLRKPAAIGGPGSGSGGPGSGGTAASGGSGGQGSGRAGRARSATPAAGSERAAEATDGAGAPAGSVGDGNEDDGDPGAPGIHLEDGPRRLLERWIKDARTSEAEVLKRWPRVDIGNVTEVMNALRDLAAGERSEEPQE